MVNLQRNNHPFIMHKWDNKRYIIDNDPNIFRSSLDLYDVGNIYGQFAVVMKNSDGTYEAVRDSLGIGKLFYCRDDRGELHFSRFFYDLLSFKMKIYSLPAGFKVRIDSKGIEKIHSLSTSKANEKLTIKSFKDRSDESVLDFQNDFTNRINHVFASLRKKEDMGYKIFIALSGGLDSSIIAIKSAEYLRSPLACTLDLGESEDSEKSEKIAQQIGIEHRIFKTNRDEILDALKEAPRSCQDYRDFNVHCAALNILLARNIQALIKKDHTRELEKSIILTGDLMNEFTCDYASEIIGGKEYYKLPRVGKKQLQQFLIGGLDTSDRELSPFASYGLRCIQPFAILWDLYATLDESILMHDDPKKLLNLFMVDEFIKSLIPKVKLRAQVGSRENMGILGICHHLGINEELFLQDLLSNEEYTRNDVPLFVGRYDMERMK